MRTYLHYDVENIREVLHKLYPSTYSVTLKWLGLNARKKPRFSNDFDGWRDLYNVIIDAINYGFNVPQNQEKLISEFFGNAYSLLMYMQLTNIYVENLKEYTNITDIKAGWVTPISKVLSRLDFKGVDGSGACIYYNAGKYRYKIGFIVNGSGQITMGIDFFNVETHKFGNCGCHDITDIMKNEDKLINFKAMEYVHEVNVKKILRNINRIVSDFCNPEVRVVSACVAEDSGRVERVNGKERHILTSEENDIFIQMRTNTRYYKECAKNGTIRTSGAHGTHARPVEHRAYYKERVLKNGTVRPAFYIVKNAGVPCTAKKKAINVTKLK